jgi:hypothetical protein
VNWGRQISKFQAIIWPPTLEHKNTHVYWRQRHHVRRNGKGASNFEDNYLYKERWSLFVTKLSTIFILQNFLGPTAASVFQIYQRVSDRLQNLYHFYFRIWLTIPPRDSHK